MKVDRLWFIVGELHQQDFFFGGLSGEQREPMSLFFPAQIVVEVLCEE